MEMRQVLAYIANYDLCSLASFLTIYPSSNPASHTFLQIEVWPKLTVHIQHLICFIRLHSGCLLSPSSCSCFLPSSQYLIF